MKPVVLSVSIIANIYWDHRSDKQTEINRREDMLKAPIKCLNEVNLNVYYEIKQTLAHQLIVTSRSFSWFNGVKRSSALPFSRILTFAHFHLPCLLCCIFLSHSPGEDFLSISHLYSCEKHSPHRHPHHSPTPRWLAVSQQSSYYPLKVTPLTSCLCWHPGPHGLAEHRVTSGR